MSLERKNGMLRRLDILEAGKMELWEEMFARLQKYKTREGHCAVPISHKEDAPNLGAWLSKQRQVNKEGKLSVDDKARHLESLGWHRTESIVRRAVGSNVCRFGNVYETRRPLQCPYFP
jgi:fermentation-respiration switch protein FrsA (DUF1100 family)